MWDSKLVSSFAFQPRKIASSQGRVFDRDGGGWVDGSVEVSDGAKLGYRIYGKTTKTDLADGSPPHLVLIYFHANAELVTDTTLHDVTALYNCGFQTVVCPEFRGYGWSTGTPTLSRLCPDADEFMLQLPGLLKGLGIEEFQTVVMGRSIGSPCAVHVAFQSSPIKPAALIMESGLLSLLDLPFVKQFASAAPDLVNALSRESDPLGTKEKLQKIQIPTCIFHGTHDDIVPVSQAITAHQICASEDKKLVRVPAGHNDLRSRAYREYYKELKIVCCKINGLSPDEEIPGSMSVPSSLAWALSCLPGMNRCFSRRSGST